MKVRSHFIPATQGVAERKKSKRPELILLDKKGNPKYEDVKVVPNKALTVKDIMQKYMRGLPVDDSLKGSPTWAGENMTHDSPDMSKIQQMDRMEKSDLAKSAKWKIPKKQQSPSVKDNPAGDQQEGPKT